MDTLLEAVLVHAGECLEWVLNISALHGRHLEELKSDRVREALSVLAWHCTALRQVDLVGNDNTSELSARILLLDALVPLSEQVEGVWVGHVVHQANLVGLAQQIKGDLLENVLPSNVDKVQLHTVVGAALRLDLLDLVLAALGHHVVMVELVLQVLVDYLSLSYSGFSRDHHS